MPQLIADELNYDRAQLQATLNDPESGVAALLPQQCSLFSRVRSAVIRHIHSNRTRGLAVFVDAPGGTGKTHTANLMLANVRVQGEIALSVGSSGVCALLLDGGRTFHSRFRVPVPFLAGSTFNIGANSSTAQLLRRATMILWDEAPMSNRNIMEGLDRALRDMYRDTEPQHHQPFGGKVVVLCGDFRQVLPVIKRANRPAIVNAALNRSPLWRHFRIHHLTVNMRIELASRAGGPGVDQRAVDYAAFLLQVGNGELAPVSESGAVALPDDICMPSSGAPFTNLAALCDWVWPQLAPNSSNVDWVSERGILTPKNSTSKDINELMTARFPGAATTCQSADSIAHVDGADDNRANVPVEFLNTLDGTGMPPHNLELKPGMPLMLLRNLNFSAGLCNGTRLVLRQHRGNVLECMISTGKHRGNIAFIPRVTLTPSDGDFPFAWQRRQFPVRQAFAMTINKSQGQEFKQLGIYLPENVFTHGQLYVALSRVGHPDRVRVAAISAEGDPANSTRNVVYREAFTSI